MDSYIKNFINNPSDTLLKSSIKDLINFFEEQIKTDEIECDEKSFIKGTMYHFVMTIACKENINYLKAFDAIQAIIAEHFEEKKDA